jgi:E3 ubiquitin-protein ligase NEDD4
MSLSMKDLRKVWRFEFIGEPGIDNGQVAQEWYELVSEQMFDPNLGLWQPSISDPSRLQINPASEICCPDDHLYYFRFVGRILGKALFDGHHIKGRMAKYLYKHLLGWPVMFIDLKDFDEAYYYSLRGLIDMGEEVDLVGVDFTVTEEALGVKYTVELVEDGSNVNVTARNVLEYVEACLKYRLLGQCEMQINELLLGFFDVVPEPLLGIFDYQELELLMSEVA